MSLMRANMRLGGCATRAERVTCRMAGLSHRSAPVTRVRIRHTGTMARTMPAPSKADKTERLIAENRKARYEYFIEDRFEAGLVLQGWEVKAMRAGRAQLSEAYVFVRAGECFL